MAISSGPSQPIGFGVYKGITLILEVVALIHGEAMKNGVSVRTQLAEGLAPIEGDRVQLQQAILNLIINAIEAMSGTNDAPRKLPLSTEKTEPDAVHVAVRDSGPGLAPVALERLFDAFYTTKTERFGAGAVDLPLDHRSAWRTVVGDRELAPRRHLSIHGARPFGHCDVIGG
jgi:signal transduction histidine kinase